MQARLSSKGFSNTSSGKMNDRIVKNQHKLLDLDDFDVQMLSPQFLQQKTLKKPLTEMGIHLKQTNKQGFGQLPNYDKANKSRSQQSQYQCNKTNNISKKTSKTESTQYKYITSNNLDIKPAYQQNNFFQDKNINYQIPTSYKDKNSIISAMLKKAQKPQIIQIKIRQPAQTKATIKKEGPAQKKLKKLFGKQVSHQLVPTKNKEPEEISEEIGQDIQQSIQEEYGNQSFQKMSGAYESGIKQSIRQSIASSSGMIKESIRQEIPEAMSYQSSHRKSIQQIREQVPQSISGSMNKSSIGQQIEQQVYEEVFQQMSISDELSKSKMSKFKRSKDHDDKFELSISASKGFRTKTNVAKSIKLADQISLQKKRIDKFNDKLKQQDKLAGEILKEQQKANALKKKIANILKNDKIQKPILANPNKDLLYKFRIQINRLITSQNFTSKLRKLTSFLNFGSTSIPQSVSSLEDKILGNVLGSLEELKKHQIQKSEVDNLRNDYDKKLQMMLKDQEMKLRVEMDKKMHEKDLQYKKMIAELQQKFSKGMQYIGSQGQKTNNKLANLGKVQVQSDYSIDSDQISWKQDLWQLLPEYEKKKLYEKQSAQVANFLTDIMVKEVKQESLNRSGYDLSFEFPDDLNVSASLESSFPDFNRKKLKDESQPQIFRSSINREQLIKNIEPKQQYFPPLKDIKKSVKPQIPAPVDIQSKPIQKNDTQQQKRDTTSVSQVIKILSKYKNMYLKKKNDTIRKVIKTLQLKTKQNQPLSGHISDIKILYDKQISASDLPYVRAYEQQLVMQLTGFFNKHANRKYNFIEQQMRKLYDRFVVTCQIKTAQASVGSPIGIVPHENYIDLTMGKQQKKFKDDIVNQIVNVLSLEFAREMPRKGVY